MSQERTTSPRGVLPVERVDQLERRVQQAYRQVEAEPDQVAEINVRIKVSTDPATKRPRSTWKLSSQIGDAETVDMGEVRDGQLVLPGTEVRVDEAPESGYQDSFLALPRKVANG